MVVFCVFHIHLASHFEELFLHPLRGILNREPARLLLIPLNHFNFNTAKKSCGKLYLCYKAHHLRSQTQQRVVHDKIYMIIHMMCL